MKTYYLIMAILIPLYSSAQNDFNHTVYYKNGDIREQGHLENKKKTGPWVVYAADGEIIEKGNYTDGIKSGFWQEPIEEFDIFNIACCWQGEYSHGKKTGKWYNTVREGYIKYKKGRIRKLVMY